MTMYENVMNKIPDYYPTMYHDGYKPEEILMAKRREMHEDLQEQEPPTNINITTEIKKK